MLRRCYLSLLLIGLLRVSTRLKEADNAAIGEHATLLQIYQRRCLGHLSPVVRNERGNQRRQRKRLSHEEQHRRANDRRVRPDSQPDSGRRIRRPTMIRRPKLVGKSVDGAAIHAKAAARARASSSRFKLQPPQTAIQPRAVPGSPKAVQYMRNQKDIARVDQRLDEKDDERIGFLRNEYERLPHFAWRTLFSVSRETIAWRSNRWTGDDLSNVKRQFLLSKTKHVWTESVIIPPLIWRSWKADTAVSFGVFMEHRLRHLGPTTLRLHADGGEDPQIFLTMKAKAVTHTATVLLIRCWISKLRRHHTMYSSVCLAQFPYVGKEGQFCRRGTVSKENRCSSIDRKTGEIKVRHRLLVCVGRMPNVFWQALLSLGGGLFDAVSSMTCNQVLKQESTMAVDPSRVVEELIHHVPLHDQQE